MEKYWIHPQKDESVDFDLYSDVAILKLGRRIEFDYKKYGDSPICLNDGVIDTDEAYFRGFGLTLFETSGELKKEGKLSLITNNDDCYKKIANSGKHIWFQNLHEGINDEILCSTGLETFKVNKRTDAYRIPRSGDSGAPLYTIKEEKQDGSVAGEALIALSQGEGYGRGLLRKREPLNVQWWNRIRGYVPWIRCVVEKSLLGVESDKIQQECKLTTSSEFEPECSHKKLWENNKNHSGKCE